MTLQELFTGPETWTQGHYAKTADGDDTGAGDCEAVCWCLTGALLRVYPNSERRAVVREKLGKAMNAPGESTTMWNDDPSRTFADIRRVIEEANV